MVYVYEGGAFVHRMRAARHENGSSANQISPVICTTWKLCISATLLVLFVIMDVCSRTDGSWMVSKGVVVSGHGSGLLGLDLIIFHLLAYPIRWADCKSFWRADCVVEVCRIGRLRGRGPRGDDSGSLNSEQRIWKETKGQLGVNPSSVLQELPPWKLPLIF